MAKTNIEWSTSSDKGIVADIGQYIKHERLGQNRTQESLAEAAGINRWTLSKIENGEPISLISLIQILRALDRLQVLDSFIVKTEISPLELAKLEKRKRQRASGKDDIENGESTW